MNSHDVTGIKFGNRHFKEVFKSLPFVGLIFDRHGRILDANREAERISGLKLHDFRGKPFSRFGLLDKKNLAKAFSEFRKNLEGKITGKTVYTIKDKNGKEHLLELIGIPIKQDGKVIVILDIGYDITEQRRTEDALRESENKFKAISESAQDAILMMNGDSNIIYWNRSAEEMFGYKKKEALGQDLHNLIVPKRFREGFRKGMRGFVKTGRGAAVGRALELAGLKKDGTEFPIELSSASVKIQGAWNAVDIIRDISERKQKDERLKRLVRMNRKVIEKAPLGIYIANNKGKIEYVNPEMLRISGDSHRQFLSMNIFRLPTYRKVGIAEKIKECIEKGVDFSAGPIKYTSQYGRKESTRIFRGIPIEEYGERKALVFVDDVTVHERLKDTIKRERDTIKKYLQVAGVMFVVLDRKGNIQMINKRGCEILGCDSGNWIGKNWFETCIPERVKNETKSVFLKIVAGEKEGAEYFENPVKTKNGEEKMVAWHNTILKDDDGNIIGTLSSGEDITKQKKAEEELKKSQGLFTNIFESMVEGIIVLGKDFRYIHFNSSMEKISGVSREKVLKTKRPWEVFPHIVKHGVDKMMKTAMKGTVTRKRIIPYKLENGVEGFTSEMYFPLKDSRGGITGIVGIIREVSKEVKAERELETKINDMGRFSKMSVGRELKMVELKKRIEQLEGKLREKDQAGPSGQTKKESKPADSGSGGKSFSEMRKKKVDGE